MVKNSKVLLINDDLEQFKGFKDKLISEKGYEVFSESTAGLGVSKAKEYNFDVVVLRLGMPGTDSAELIKSLRKIDHDCVIIAFNRQADALLQQEILNLGAYGFMNDISDLEKWVFLIDKGIELHAALTSNRRLVNILQEQNLSLQKQNALLARRIEESTRNLSRLYEDLRTTYMRTIKVLAQTIDARDHYTHNHSENVKNLSVAICEELKLPLKDIEIITEACELHDLGKIGVEDSILTKDTGLTADEWERIKRHPQIGAQILESLPFLSGVTDLIRQHHERYDGTGYPEGRKGEHILLGARIINLADAYETMRSARSYRQQPFSKENAIAEVKKHSGTQFDPKIVEAFLKIVDRLDV